MRAASRVVFVAAMLCAAALASVPVRAQRQAAAGFDLARLDRLDDVINDAIAAHQLPGAVVVVGRGDAVVRQKAYGQRAIVPSPEPMTLDTIFDIASLT